VQAIQQALEEIKALHEQLTQSPAPEIGPQAFLPFPPGVDPVAFAIEEVTQLKHWVENLQAAQLQTPQSVNWVPAASVHADETGIHFAVEIPGVAKDDVTLNVTGGELIVRGERRPPQFGPTSKPVVVEQAWGTFERRFPLPPWGTAETIKARYAHGIVEIDVIRHEQSTPTEVQIAIG
jgi:HSP20 family protein